MYEVIDGDAQFTCASKDPSTGNIGDPCSVEGVGCDYGSVCAPVDDMSICGNDSCCLAYCCADADDCDGTCDEIADSNVGLCTSG